MTTAVLPLWSDLRVCNTVQCISLPTCGVVPYPDPYGGWVLARDYMWRALANLHWLVAYLQNARQSLGRRCCSEEWSRALTDSLQTDGINALLSKIHPCSHEQLLSVHFAWWRHITFNMPSRRYMACHVAEGAFAERFHRIEDLEDHFQALSSA